MITYESLAVRPSAFLSLSGLTLPGFEALYHDFATAYATDRQLCHRPPAVADPQASAATQAGSGAKFSQDASSPRTGAPGS